MKKPYFPLFVDLSEKKVYVIGAGTIAKRRIRTLMEFTDQLIVVAPEVNPELNALEQEGKITILRKKMELTDIADADLVIAATNDYTLNQDIYEYCLQQEILVNVYNDKKKCDFYFPGLIVEQDVVVGVTANGANHKKAKKAVEKIREILGECL